MAVPFYSSTEMHPLRPNLSSVFLEFFSRAWATVWCNLRIILLNSIHGRVPDKGGWGGRNNSEEFTVENSITKGENRIVSR